jgi:hypothetical protein
MADDNKYTRDELHITVDTSFEDILQYDHERKRLDFAIEPGSFKKLSEDEVRLLSDFARTQYYLAKNFNERTVEAEKSPVKGLKVSQRLVPPGEKLEVEYQDGWRDKWHPVWGNAYNHDRYLRDGYQQVDQSEVVTFAPTLGSGSSVQIGTPTETELILYKLPLGEHKKRMKLNEEKSRDNIGSVEESTRESIREAGGIVRDDVVGDTPDGRNWSGPAEGES